MYRYLLFRFYALSAFVNRNETRHAENAVIMLSVVMLMNAFSLLALIDLISGHDLLASLQLRHVHGALLAALLMVIHYVWLKSCVDENALLRRYKSESRQQLTRGNLRSGLFVAGSLLMVICLNVVRAAA